ncbi:hypothetical protein CB0940_10152 [Cercospora beticola]|uniref:F-box domain-containing protein n=1 Tax=Cercospora beticola TaxID=122368 RepID=A0A2G5HU21_CERBT|nr:hypothetical protein CB0940_10152 [Cercospora beticola]PIA96028.1 hypothetical protein CB0940_10152 [Cercospora beticola]WPB06859.1 hypothetical protein RHO25_011519 [Cercospora beticola]CAK1366783.1 unnamed protein product [Cercospora beticola]
MPRTKKQKRNNLSSELGNGDFAIDYNAKGRAIRKCRTQQRESPFEDSAVAISDNESDYEEETVGDVISVAPAKKRKRSPSPLARLPSDDVANFSDSSMSDAEEESTLRTTPPATGTTVHLTVNIPPGHQGPITLNIDPKNFASCQSVSASPCKPDRLTQTTLTRLNTRSVPKTKKYAGFLDLPAELRNDIYRLIFVTENATINFATPDNFSRSAALLRTCRQVYEEGRSILYSENAFAIERRTQRYGSFWEHEWRELGYLNVRKFMKSIGPTNTALIRRISFMLEDAVPCLNPSMRTNEERRFVHDDDLMSVLRHLGNHAQLQTIDLHFHGRRRVDRTDDRFLDYMKRLKADAVRFVDWPPDSKYPRSSKQDESVKSTLLAHCTRKKKKFDI